MTAYKVHPAAALFPLMGETELQALADDIREHGLRQPIILLGVLILDGRNRWKACHLAGVEPRTVQFKGQDPVAFVLSQNLHRRHLTASQRACVALNLECMYAATGKARQHDHRPNRGTTGRSSHLAAKALGVSHGMVEKAKKIAAQAPDVLAEVQAGKKTLGQAELELWKRRKASERAEGQRLAGKGPCDLYLGDILEVGARIANASVDLIIADPPYPREFLVTFSKLGTFAARVLKPGGRLLVLSGQSYLPEVLSRLNTEGLTYVWTLAYLTPSGRGTPLRARPIVSHWKPILYFVKGQIDRRMIRGDVYSADPADMGREWHKWEQSNGGIASLVEAFSKPGDLVVSPFLGGGTAVVAALKLGRRVIGIDNDAQAIASTQKRLTA